MTDVNPWAEIIGPCYRSDSFARALGWTDAEAKRGAASLSVLELVTEEGILLYPAFQVRDGRVVPGLSEVLHTLHTGTESRWTWAQWLNTRLDDGNGTELPSAIEQLCAGELEDVLLEARHDAWAWAGSVLMDFGHRRRLRAGTSLHPTW